MWDVRCALNVQRLGARWALRGSVGAPSAHSVQHLGAPWALHSRTPRDARSPVQSIPTSGDVGVPILGHAICCIPADMFCVGVVVASLGWALRCSVGRVSGGCLAFAVGFVLVHGTACVFHSSVNIHACGKPRGLSVGSCAVYPLDGIGVPRLISPLGCFLFAVEWTSR